MTTTYTDVNANATDLKIRAGALQRIRLDERLLLRYASSMVRLIIFMGHCGPDHPCTMNEVRLLRRYDGAIIERHLALNSRVERSVIMRSLSNSLVSMSRNMATTLDLEPEFILEILADFEKAVVNRFAIGSPPNFL